MTLALDKKCEGCPKRMQCGRVRSKDEGFGTDKSILNNAASGKGAEHYKSTDGASKVKCEVRGAAAMQLDKGRNSHVC